MFDAVKSLFFDSSDHLTVANQHGGCIGVIGVDAKYEQRNPSANATMSVTDRVPCGRPNGKKCLLGLELQQIIHDALIA
jgi:hypothetical protein